MNVMNEHKIQIKLDKDNFRFIAFPLKVGQTMDIPSIFRAIKRQTTYTWRYMAEFCGLRSQSEAFKIAYLGNSNNAQTTEVMDSLKKFMVIDVSKNQAYLYHIDHKPAGGLPIMHVGPRLINNEPKLKVTEGVPAKATTRLIVKDPLDRVLTMKITPTNGYILGIRDITLCNPNMTYVVTGTAKSLNALLCKIHFVGAPKQTNANIVVSVDDCEGDIASVSSTTVTLSITPAPVVSVPALNVPQKPTCTLGTATAFAPITVEDADGKLMEFRITPFGCDIIGFKNYLHRLVPGEVHNIYGRPETINADIAELKVIAHQENVQIGVELYCGKTRLRKYVVFNVKSPDGAPEEVDPEAPIPGGAPSEVPGVPTEAPSAPTAPVESSTKAPQPAKSEPAPAAPKAESAKAAPVKEAPKAQPTAAQHTSKAKA